MEESNLAIYWTQSGIAAGLLRAVIYMPESGVAARVDLEIDGQNYFSGSPLIHHDGNIHINFHTHLLQNGQHTIKIALEQGGNWYVSSQSFNVSNMGELAVNVTSALNEVDADVFFFGDCDSTRYCDAAAYVRHWMDEPDASARIDEMLSEDKISIEEHATLKHFLEFGFVVLRNKLPDSMIDAANEAIDQAIAEKYQGYEYGSSQRLEQMHINFPAIREVWLYPPVHRVLSLIFGAESQACQSLVYAFGSQQDAHQDTVHLTPFPAGAMCGVWIALEDVLEGSGELAIYPRSHRLPRIYMDTCGASKVRGDWTEFGAKVVARWRAELEKGRFDRKIYNAKRGDILIWHENLMHEGSIRSNKKLSRRSVVTHNFARGAIVYYDSSGDVGHVHENTI